MTETVRTWRWIISGLARALSGLAHAFERWAWTLSRQVDAGQVQQDLLRTLEQQYPGAPKRWLEAVAARMNGDPPAPMVPSHVPDRLPAAKSDPVVPARGPEPAELPRYRAEDRRVHDTPAPRGTPKRNRLGFPRPRAAFRERSNVPKMAAETESRSSRDPNAEAAHGPSHFRAETTPAFSTQPARSSAGKPEFAASGVSSQTRDRPPFPAPSSENRRYPETRFDGDDRSSDRVAPQFDRQFQRNFHVTAVFEQISKSHRRDWPGAPAEASRPNTLPDFAPHAEDPWPALPVSDQIVSEAQPSLRDDHAARREQREAGWNA